VWVAATIVGACYGVFLISAALWLPSALIHPIARERRWLIAALLFSDARLCPLLHLRK
jgi:hypothetical protein